MLASLPKPEVIITHESDLDGLASGLLLQRLAQKLFNTSVPLEAYHYNNLKQRPMKEKSAWVCDFSFDPRMDKPNWAIIDHHATEVMPKTATFIHDLNRSAGLICYDLCRQHELGNADLDRLIHLNNVSDLFLEEDPDFVLANDYANLIKTYGFWNIHALIDGKLERLLNHPLLQVMEVKRRIEDPIGLEWSKANVTQLSATVGLVNTAVGNINLIVHQMLEQQATPYPVLLTLFRRSNGTIIVSLRSRNGEALKVAQQLQGGGHANACGATLPRYVQNIPDAVQYLKQILNPQLSKSGPLNSLESAFAGLDLK